MGNGLESYLLGFDPDPPQGNWKEWYYSLLDLPEEDYLTVPLYHVQKSELNGDDYELRLFDPERQFLLRYGVAELHPHKEAIARGETWQTNNRSWLKHHPGWKEKSHV